jgi:hypothetical protein
MMPGDYQSRVLCLTDWRRKGEDYDLTPLAKQFPSSSRPAFKALSADTFERSFGLAPGGMRLSEVRMWFGHLRKRLWDCGTAVAPALSTSIAHVTPAASSPVMVPQAEKGDILQTNLGGFGTQSTAGGAGAPAAQPGMPRGPAGGTAAKAPVIKLRVKASKGAKVRSAGQHLLDLYVQPWLCWHAATPVQAANNRLFACCSGDEKAASRQAEPMMHGGQPLTIAIHLCYDFLRPSTRAAATWFYCMRLLISFLGLLLLQSAMPLFQLQHINHIASASYRLSSSCSATLAAPSALHTRRCPARQSACEQAVPQYQATRHFEHRWLPAPCLAAGPPSPARLAQRRKAQLRVAATCASSSPSPGCGSRCSSAAISARREAAASEPCRQGVRTALNTSSECTACQICQHCRLTSAATPSLSAKLCSARCTGGLEAKADGPCLIASSSPAATSM